MRRMRRATPEELRIPAVPAITARVTEAELERWFPIPFDDINDPVAVPEPSRGALVQLEGGAYVVVYYGKDSGQLFVEIPATTQDSSALVAEFFREVPMPTSRVSWHREDIALPGTSLRSPRKTGETMRELKPTSAKRSARRVSLPKKHK